LKRFQKNTALEIEGCRRRYGITKRKTELVLAETELKQMTTVNFRRFKEKTCF
jgi:hypothetical protein